MLVPDMRTASGSDGWGWRSAEREDSTSTPGAIRSGLVRPSRVGPALLNGAIGRSAECASYAPTPMLRRPLQIVPVVESGSTSDGSKRGWQVEHAGSRSTQQ